MEQKILKRKFNEGDIVYWCHRSKNDYSVHFGMVHEHFSDAVYVDYLELRETRLVDGVPIDEFKSEEKRRKLPKGWSYNTKLYEITHEELPAEEKNFIDNLKLKDVEGIKEAYKKGYLIKRADKFNGEIEEDITNEGYRIIKTYPFRYDYPSYVSIKPWKVYFTYEEAKKEVDEQIAEFHRQASLSDYDWAVEQIDNKLKKLKFYTGCDDEEIKRYRDFLLSLNNVEDIETRVSLTEIQWRYSHQKRWKSIEL